MKILVVDDMKIFRDMIAKSLMEWGHVPILAKSGNEAIKIFNKIRPDLIILDVVMKGMSGFECAKQLRLLAPDDWIPIIFLSGTVSDSAIEQGINAGGDDYLAKPFSEITLAAKIKAMERISKMRLQLIETTKNLSILSSTDTLTGLYNRLQFDRVIKEKITNASHYNTIFAVLFIDLDNFKTVNDIFGHHTGDLLLQAISKRLNSCLRKNDFVARMGGDEFAVILSELESPDIAGHIAHKILNVFSSPFQLENNLLHISASIGIACYPFAGTDKESLVQNADIAMYQAKSRGRNNYKYHTDDHNKKFKERIILEDALKFALEKNELFILYQPIFNLKTKKMIGVEALLRWMNKELGIVSSDVFVPIAEECGLINPIGKWILKTICQQGAKWYQEDPDFKLSFNISPMQLIDKNFLPFLKKVIRQTKIPPSILELELTETSIMTHPTFTENILKEIHNIGISISIDDFGTGYSSLTLLQRLPFRALKIDKSFIAGISSKINNTIIINSVITLGKSLGLRIIAEGIETKEQLQFLIDRGCELGQGYFLSKPLSVEIINEVILNKKPILIT